MIPTERNSGGADIPVPCRPVPCRIEQAYLALSRGSALLGRTSARSDAVLRAEAPIRARVLMNRLRELDRLTAILLNEMAGAAGIAPAQTAAVRRCRSVAAKLGAVRILLGVADPDQARIDMIGRLRGLLARGHNPPAPAAELAAVYRFYGELADRLFAQRAARRLPGPERRIAEREADHAPPI